MELLTGNPILFVLGLFVVILIFFIAVYMRDIKYGMIIWLIAGVFVTPMVFAISLPGVPDIYLERIIFVLLFFLFLVKIAVGQEDFIPLARLDFLWIILLFILLISMWRTGFFAELPFEEHPSRVFLAGFFFPFSFYLFGKNIFYTEERLRTLLWTSFFLYLYFVLTAYLEHFRLDQFIYPGYIANPLAGYHFGRARGPFLNAAVNGWVFVTLFALTLFLRTQVESILARVFIALGLFLCPLAVFYTYTRAVWLSFLSALIVLSFSKKLLLQRKFIFFPIIILILIGAANWEKLGTKEREAGGVMQIEEVEDRIKLFNITKAVFRENPLFGIGFGRFRRAALSYGPEVARGASIGTPSQHNIFFSILSEVGLLGLIPFIIIILYGVRYSISLFRYLGEEGFINKDLVITFWAVFLTYLISASFIQTQYFLVANVIFFLWSGIIVGLYQRRVVLQEDSD